MALKQFDEDDSEIAGEMSGDAGKNRMARIKRQKADRVKPDRIEKNNRGAEPGFSCEVKNQAVFILPFPEKRMQSREEQGEEKDGSDQGCAVFFGHDEEASKNQF